MTGGLLRTLLLLISGVTILSGFTQLVAPGLVLSVVATHADPFSSQLFATVGMFMLITGAMFFQHLWQQSREPAVPLWIAVQKIAAAALVGLGISRGLLAPLSLGVAGFDAVSGVLALLYWRRLSP